MQNYARKTIKSALMGPNLYFFSISYCHRYSLIQGSTYTDIFLWIRKGRMVLDILRTYVREKETYSPELRTLSSLRGQYKTKLSYT